MYIDKFCCVLNVFSYIKIFSVHAFIRWEEYVENDPNGSAKVHKPNIALLYRIFVSALSPKPEID